MPSDIAGGFANAVGTAGGLLQGVGDEQLKQLNLEQMTSGLNYIKDASGKAIDFMTQVNQMKAKSQMQQLAIEAKAELEKVKIAAHQTEQSRKIDADKAKSDYENFFTMTPELADGIFKSSDGKLDFRRAVGQRHMTKVIMPLVQLFGKEMESKDKANAAAASKKTTSQKDLNALKAFTGEYDKKKKEFDDPLKAAMATRNPQLQSQRDKDQQWLTENEPKYNEAIKKTGEMGGLSDTETGDGTVTPPATSSSDIDALIDKAFK